MFWGFFLSFFGLSPFLHEKNSYFRKYFLDYSVFYSVRAFAPIRQTVLLKILGEDGCMGRPHLKFFWGTVPRSPLASKLYRIILLQIVRKWRTCPTKKIENTGHAFSGIRPAFIYIPDKEPKYRTVRLNTAHRATLSALCLS